MMSRLLEAPGVCAAATSPPPAAPPPTIPIDRPVINPPRRFILGGFAPPAPYTRSRGDPLIPAPCAWAHALRAFAFAARTTRPATGMPDSMRRSASSDVRAQPRCGEDPLDIGPRVSIPAVKFEPVVDAFRGSGGMLEREDQQPGGPQRARRGGYDRVEVAEVDERVSRGDQIEPLAVVAEVLRHLALFELLVGQLLLRPRRACLPRDRRPPGAARRAPGADRRVRCRSPRRARRAASPVRRPPPQSWQQPAPARGTTAVRASTRSWRRSCRTSARRIRSRRARARRGPCTRRACAALSDRPAPPAAIRRRWRWPHRSRRARSAPARAACALPCASA